MKNDKFLTEETVKKYKFKLELFMLFNTNFVEKRVIKFIGRFLFHWGYRIAKH